MTRKNRIKVTCAYCGSVHEVVPSKVKNRINYFCTRECYNNYQRLHPYQGTPKAQPNCTCEQCGKPLHKSAYQLKANKHTFCSRECQNKFQAHEISLKAQADLNAVCAYCNKPFHKSTSSLGKHLDFCCGEHRQLYIESQRVVLKCQQCGKEFEVNLARKDTAKYCSTECQLAHQRRFYKHTTCAYCGKEIDVDKTTQEYSKTGLFFCSNACVGKYFSGEKSPTYKGTRNLTQILRSYFERYQRYKIFQRDNKICQICGGEAEHVHHIYPLHQIIKDFIKAHPDLDITENCYYVASLIIKESEIFKDLNNLVAVCKQCHKKIHSKSNKVSEKLDIT